MGSCQIVEGYLSNLTEEEINSVMGPRGASSNDLVGPSEEWSKGFEAGREYAKKYESNQE